MGRESEERKSGPRARPGTCPGSRARSGACPCADAVSYTHLHGGSGIPDDMVRQAISLGVCKVNVNTECQIAFTEATRKFIEDGRDLTGNGFTPRALLADGLVATKEKCIEKMTLFGSLGKA